MEWLSTIHYLEKQDQFLFITGAEHGKIGFFFYENDVDHKQISKIEVEKEHYERGMLVNERVPTKQTDTSVFTLMFQNWN